MRAEHIRSRIQGAIKHCEKKKLTKRHGKKCSDTIGLVLASECDVLIMSS